MTSDLPETLYHAVCINPVSRQGQEFEVGESYAVYFVQGKSDAWFRVAYWKTVDGKLVIRRAVFSLDVFDLYFAIFNHSPI